MTVFGDGLQTRAFSHVDDVAPIIARAPLVREAYQQAFEFGVERIYWLLLRDRKKLYFGSMGLADAKGDPRPAWEAFHQFVK